MGFSLLRFNIGLYILDYTAQKTTKGSATKNIQHFGIKVSITIITQHCFNPQGTKDKKQVYPAIGLVNRQRIKYAVSQRGRFETAKTAIRGLIIKGQVLSIL